MVSIPSVGVVVNWRNENNKSRLYPVHIRIKQANFAHYYRVPNPIKIKKDQWSGRDNAWIKPSHPFAFEINNKIIEIKGLIKRIMANFLSIKKEISELIENKIERILNTPGLEKLNSS